MTSSMGHPAFISSTSPSHCLLPLTATPSGLPDFLYPPGLQTNLSRALGDTEYHPLRSDFNLLVTHQAFDQACVGPAGFVFSPGRQDTVSRKTIPLDFEYIAAGHIHRYQVLDHPLKPGIKFVYPGSTQRISFAEMDEDKGFVEAEVLNNRIETRFLPLPVYTLWSRLKLRPVDCPQRN